MKTLQLRQGTPEWNAHRAHHHNSSEAPAMMGASPYLKRNDLVAMKASGSEQDFGRWTLEVLFERGHDVEEATRPLIEARFGLELFRATGVADDYPFLSASFDGITMDEDTAWECKQWNDAKAECVRRGVVPPEDYWQCVQALVVSRARRLIYTVSDGTTEVSCEMTLSTADQEALLSGWRQLDADVAAYKPAADAAPVVGRAPSALPALLIQVRGTVMESNLPAFKDKALEVFRKLNTNLQTDEDFADAELAVKFCSGVEERIAAAKKQALDQTVSIADLFTALDEISAEARSKRLALEKLVKTRKDGIRFEIIDAGAKALVAHVQAIERRLHEAFPQHIVSLPPVVGNFPVVVKGLKTISSLRNAVDTELARTKILASAHGDQIEANLRAFVKEAADYGTLFVDLERLVTKPGPDFLAVVRQRIADHKAAEQRRLDAEAERKRAAEAARAAAPAPAPAAPAAAPTPAPVAPQAPKPRMRANGPTAAQVVELVASTYGVDQATARGWLQRLFSTVEA